MTYIYCMQTQTNKSLKIGLSSKPQQRLKNIQTANPEEVLLVSIFPGSKSDEKWLHSKFKKYHIRGEWFENSEEILHYFRVHTILEEKNVFTHLGNNRWQIIFCGIVKNPRQLFFDVGYLPISLLTLPALDINEVYVVGVEAEGEVLKRYFRDLLPHGLHIERYEEVIDILSFPIEN